MKKSITWLCLAHLMITFHLVAQEPGNTSYDIPENTPILEEERRDLPPDFTFNDARSVLDIMQHARFYDAFVKALYSTEMAQRLDSVDAVTIFAPGNDAFDQLDDAALAQLKTPAGAAEMQEILSYHLVPEVYDRATLVSTIRLNEGVLRLRTLQGGYLALTLLGDQLYITDERGERSKINLANEKAENGVVHGVDKILFPQY
ncbi:fasciclin domain-containing protein [Maribacter sp. 2307ULW6-5]|uniref:fasciclin domain-containing protein n=1 Tax=Maribacter sp. 2307ULW6-5 TaxID=3386275 RepID=UPI0039BC7873